MATQTAQQSWTQAATPHQVADSVARQVTAALVDDRRLSVPVIGTVFMRVYQASLQAATNVAGGYPADEAAELARDDALRNARAVLEQACPWHEVEGITALIARIVRREIATFASAWSRSRSHDHR